jgi:hypothetical protein
MTQVDLGLTSVGRFDSANSAINVGRHNKSPVVVKGPFFPQVWTQGIESMEQMCDARINVIKPRILIFKGESYASNLENIMKTNLIYGNRKESM